MFEIQSIDFKRKGKNFFGQIVTDITLIFHKIFWKSGKSLLSSEFS